MGEITTRIAVLGGGPGGYVTAIRAGQLGLDTVLVEEAFLGGTCLNVGCIPSKALIHAAQTFHGATLASREPSFGVRQGAPSLDFPATMAWKDAITDRLKLGVAGLLGRAGVKILRGAGTLLDGKTIRVETDTGPETVRAEHLVLATGSVPAELATLPFGGRVVSSTGALALGAVPRRLVVVGAGYIGLELGTAFAKLGATVDVVEAAPDILPHYDEELTAEVARRLPALGVTLHLSTRAAGLTPDGAGLVAERADGTRTVLPADIVLVATGRRPRTRGFGLEQLDLAMAGPFIRIDERCATSMRNVWAVGDVTGEPMLAHRAMAQGEMLAEILAGRRRAFDRHIPSVCFTDPEIVSVGLSPQAARAAGVETVTGRFPLHANGRAMTLGAEDGFVRVTARSDNHLILGLQAVGRDVAELSTAFGLALEMGARLEDVAGTVHAHPTIGETLHEACLRALGHALHL
ncbi:dihydrolipoyl dehydrogenase [Aurantimonas sp. Leaf443]|uniref:dihydrolipoyl dehydrogenase n=1 Tax=Aurantimonas sp. Leaf443 TaxID=1736378 RepID=UPI0006FBADC7|nr:dihydrolipoyl dehydrogenase [Aurantimonas sp. Leaf443]KQT84120.1 dihydrolipoamide dehydrogenase [Aurantimonas sp. Leaf443]